jgi:hypothetical protein
MAPSAKSGHVESLLQEALSLFGGLEERLGLLVGGVNRSLGLTHELAGLGFPVCWHISKGGIEKRKLGTFSEVGGFFLFELV